MLFNKKKLVKIKFYLQFLFELTFYLPFFIILFVFKSKTQNNLTLFLGYKFRKYKNYSVNLNNYDEISLIKNFSEKTKSSYKVLYVDTQNKLIDIYMNIKIMFEIFIKRPKYFVCYSDYAKERFNLSISVLYLLSKFKLTKMMLISPDSVWQINIMRGKILEKNQFIYYGDRNLLIHKNLRKRMCPVNFSKDFFLNNQSEINNKKIDVLYIGRIKSIKQRVIELRKLNELINIEIVDTDQTHLSRNDYIKMISSAKIVINFNTAINGKVHFKGKSLEILACGSLLFEPENSYLKKKFMTPDKHYIQYKNIEDLVKKINYYLNNLNELKEISYNGRNALFKLFEKRSIWKYLLNTI